MRLRHRLEARLAVRSPFLFRGLEPARFGIDASAIRDERGRPIVPADHFKGILRDALDAMLAAEAGGVTKDMIVALLGPDSGVDEKKEGYEPKRGAILFSDLTAEGDWSNCTENEIVRIKIDDESGTVERGMLQVLELVAPLGTTVIFAGSILAFETDKTREAGLPVGDRLGPAIAALLDAALSLVPAVGAVKSAGFGEVMSAQSHIVSYEPEALIRATCAAPARRLRFDVRFDRPILVDAVHIEEYLFEGKTVIPGAAIKGALAEKLTRAGYDPRNPPLDRALAALTVHHAYPLLGDQEADRALPLSLVTYKGEPLAIHDLLMARENDPPIDGDKAPAFEADWKEDTRAHVARSIARPLSDIPARPRGHTAIDTNYTARDQALFVAVARSVFDADAGTDRLWRFEVDGHDGDKIDDDTFNMFIAALGDGLDGMGKTDATMIVEKGPIPVGPPVLPDPIQTEGAELWPIMLEADTIMIDSSGDRHDDHSDRRSAFEEIAGYFRWAHERLMGKPADIDVVNAYYRVEQRGRFVALRQWQHTGYYLPFAVAVSGSVFLLRGRIGPFVETALRRGLPAHDQNRQRLDWHTCPYVPENGYGAISVPSQAS